MPENSRRDEQQQNFFVCDYSWDAYCFWTMQVEEGMGLSCSSMSILHQGRVRLSVRKRFYTRGWSDTEEAPQGSGYGAKLPEFKEHWTMLRHRAWIWGSQVWC